MTLKQKITELNTARKVIPFLARRKKMLRSPAGHGTHKTPPGNDAA
jgi:hypothetical protein